MDAFHLCPAPEAKHAPGHRRSARVGRTSGEAMTRVIEAQKRDVITKKGPFACESLLPF